MTAAEAAAAVFGGLGLFFIAIRELSGALRRLAGPGLRRFMARAAGGPVRAAATGIVIGVITQSSSAATFVTTSLLSAGLLPARAAFTAVAWSNLGPAALVLLATIDLRLAALWLIGAIGFSSVLGLGASPRIKPLADSLLSIAVALFALSLVKGAAAILRTADPAFLASLVPHDAVLAPFLAAAALALLVQSSATPTILGIKLAEAGLLSFDQLAIIVYGACLGSGAALLVAGRTLRGTARQILLFQALFKAATALAFVAVWEIEVHAHIPLAGAAALWLGHDQPGGVAILFLIVQLAGCLCLAPLWPGFIRLAARLAPPTPAETLQRPAFIYPEAAADPPTALALAARELDRLAARLPQLLDRIRADARPGPGPDALNEGGRALEAEIRAFLAEILRQDCTPPDIARAVAEEARLDHLATLRDTLHALQALLHAVREGEVQAMAGAMAESLHFLLTELGAIAGADDAALLRDLSADRGEMMEDVRRRVTASSACLSYAAQDQLFRATTLFERAVWLVRRLVPAAPA